MGVAITKTSKETRQRRRTLTTAPVCVCISWHITAQIGPMMSSDLCYLY